eukprot:2772513-Lingulodinium_polyedra.AAC.1
MWLASAAQFDDHCKGEKRRRRAHGGPRPSPSQLRAAQEAAAQALLLVYIRCARRAARATHAACHGAHSEL